VDPRVYPVFLICWDLVGWKLTYQDNEQMKVQRGLRLCRHRREGADGSEKVARCLVEWVETNASGDIHACVQAQPIIDGEFRLA